MVRVDPSRTGIVSGLIVAMIWIIYSTNTEGLSIVRLSLIIFHFFSWFLIGIFFGALWNKAFHQHKKSFKILFFFCLFLLIISILFFLLLAF